MKKKKKLYTPKDIKFFCDYNKNIFNNIKEFKHYLSRKKYLLENGYSPSAVWDTDVWFVSVMISILSQHLEWNKTFLDQEDKQNAELNENIERMIVLLKKMGEKDITEEDDEQERTEFFRLFSDNFHALWN